MTEIKQLLADYGISQSELSRRYEIPLRTVQDWCAGVRTPPPYVSALIEKALDSEKVEVLDINEAMEKMSAFGNSVINEGGKHLNAIGYDGESQKDDDGNYIYRETVIAFQRNHEKLYAKTVSYAVSIGGKIMHTHPGTYEVTIRFCAPYKPVRPW